MRKEYMIFQNMLNCYQKVDLNARCDAECNISFFFLARTLAEMDVRNPFSFGEKGFSEYDDMMFFFQKWNKTKKTCAFKQRFLMAAYDLCDTVKENIFDKEDPVEVVSLDEMKEQEVNRFFGVVDDVEPESTEQTNDNNEETSSNDNQINEVVSNEVDLDQDVIDNIVADTIEEEQVSSVDDSPGEVETEELKPKKMNILERIKNILRKRK